MRIAILVFYFCLIFYGSELLTPTSTVDRTSTAYFNIEIPKKESVKNNSICAEYSTYIKCESLTSNEVWFEPIKKSVPLTK